MRCEVRICEQKERSEDVGIGVECEDSVEWGSLREDGVNRTPSFLGIIG